MNLQQFGPIEEEGKVTAEEVEVAGTGGWSYRIVNYSVDPQRVVKGGDVIVEGKVQKKAWWPWASWGAADRFPVHLKVAGVEQACMVTAKDGSFSFRVTIPWEVGQTGAVVVKAVSPKISPVMYPPPNTNPGDKIECLEDKYDKEVFAETSPVVVQVVSGPVSEEEEGKEEGVKPKPFLDYLTNFQFSKMWKYHKEKTIAMGAGGVALLMMMGGGGE